MSNRQKSNMERIQRTKGAKSWAKNWQNTKGGFNPDVFNNLDNATRQKLRDYQIGPPIQMGDKLNAGNATLVGHWSDGDNYGFHNNPRMNEATYGDIYQHGTNRGSVQQAVWEMGLPNIKTSKHLTQFLDRTDALTAKHGNFLKDGWDPKDIMLYREAPQQAVAKKRKKAPVKTTVDVPKVAKKQPVPKELIPGVDSYTPQRYLTSNMKDNNQSSDDDSYDPTSIFNYGYGNDQGYYPNRYENEQGLIDREGSIEDAGSLLNDWIFKIKNDEKLNASTRIDNIANEDFNYGKDNRSTSRYHTSNYY